MKVNILVDYDYHARVADFGLSLVGVDNNFDITTSGTGAGNVRWRAPEFHHMSANRCTFAGDLWAFGCLCLSVSSLRN
jgi:serine/threonine protein kinase